MVLAAGDPHAPPLVFLHGGGTFHGWRFAEPWTSAFRVLIPHHPGFGESGDLEGLRDIEDLVLHYTDLFDQLELTVGVNLVGFSLGGRIAARFAIAQKHRLRRLVLVAPAGLRVPGIEVEDFFHIPPEDLVPRLVHKMETILPYLPADPNDVDFTVDRYRETRTLAIMTWEQPYDRFLPRWLGRVDVPTLVVWGDEDRLVPPTLAPAVGGSPARRDGGHVPGRRPPRARRIARSDRSRGSILRCRLTNARRAHQLSPPRGAT